MIDLDQIFSRLSKMVNDRRVASFRDPRNDRIIMFAVGKEWTAKLAALYQAWIIREQINSAMPFELEDNRINRTELLDALVESLTPDESIDLLNQIMEHLCQSTSHLKDQPVLGLHLLGRLQAVMKNAKVVRLLEEADASSTKCSNEPESDDKTATSRTSASTDHPTTTSTSTTPTDRPDASPQPNS